MKTIGLIGGMSWESSRTYYEMLNRGVQRELGALHSARVILVSVDFAEIAALQSEGRWEEAGEWLAAEATRLETAGAEVLALATNTMHKCAPAITAAISIPFLHIVDPLVAGLRAEHRRRPLLLGTRFTMEDRFFLDRLEAAEFQPLVPPEADRESLHCIIFDELCRGWVTDSAAATMQRIVSDGRSRGADSVILGCTELGMVSDEGALALQPYDTTRLHANALVKLSLSEPG